jgi:hypothetical protein
MSLRVVEEKRIVGTGRLHSRRVHDKTVETADQAALTVGGYLGALSEGEGASLDSTDSTRVIAPFIFA